MSLLKDDRTLKLDDASLQATEALGLYRDLQERVENPELQTLLREHAGRHARLLDRLDDARRRHGELPQAGDPERSHLEAAGVYLRAVMLPGETDMHFLESLLEAADNVAAHLDTALGLDLQADLERLLTELRTANAAFESRLRALTKQHDHSGAE